MLVRIQIRHVWVSHMLNRAHKEKDGIYPFNSDHIIHSSSYLGPIFPRLAGDLMAVASIQSQLAFCLMIPQQ